MLAEILWTLSQEGGPIGSLLSLDQPLQYDSLEGQVKSSRSVYSFYTDCNGGSGRTHHYLLQDKVVVFFSAGVREGGCGVNALDSTTLVGQGTGKCHY